MKNKLIFSGIVVGLLAATLPALAAVPGVQLGHGGIGQKAGDTTDFGVAICNNGAQTVSAVPFAVTLNGKTVAATVDGPLSANCQYTYLTYSIFDVTAGNTYSATVAIDPNHILGTAAVAALATYTITVPVGGQVLGASAISESERQSLLAQLAQMTAILQGLLAKLGL
ncbi:MAG: hypothetical protein KGJ13_00805 [Patescibacteria group bacterium]|nr:hypothetical protein [Patescibacteria group bacterium]